MELLISSGISILVQLVKKLVDRIGLSDEASTLASMAILFVFSFVAAYVYSQYTFYDTWTGARDIAVQAAGIWALILRRFEK